MWRAWQRLRLRLDEFTAQCAENGSGERDFQYFFNSSEAWPIHPHLYLFRIGKNIRNTDGPEEWYWSCNKKKREIRSAEIYFGNWHCTEHKQLPCPVWTDPFSIVIFLSVCVGWPFNSHLHYFVAWNTHPLNLLTHCPPPPPPPPTHSLSQALKRKYFKQRCHTTYPVLPKPLTEKRQCCG